MPAHTEQPQAFAPAYLRTLARAILGSPHFTTHTLNRDFVQTRGFSVAFRADGRAEVERAFPAFVPYLARALRADCNAFYLNPLELARGSRVDPHVDRSLRSYCKDVLPPVAVSVLYVNVPPALVGGTLVLARGKKQLACVRPVAGTLVVFDGDLTHSIERVESAGSRLSLVCEQYCLEPDEWERVPRFALETRARSYS
jgi:predicted 2-oxoglutarate/Fe(II)-dependent dioxygenase YbiX